MNFVRKVGYIFVLCAISLSMELCFPASPDFEKEVSTLESKLVYGDDLFSTKEAIRNYLETKAKNLYRVFCQMKFDEKIGWSLTGVSGLLISFVAICNLCSKRKIVTTRVPLSDPASLSVSAEPEPATSVPNSKLEGLPPADSESVSSSSIPVPRPSVVDHLELIEDFAVVTPMPGPEFINLTIDDQETPVQVWPSSWPLPAGSTKNGFLFVPEVGGPKNGKLFMFGSAQQQWIEFKPNPVALDQAASEQIELTSPHSDEESSRPSNPLENLSTQSSENVMGSQFQLPPAPAPVESSDFQSLSSSSSMSQPRKIFLSQPKAPGFLNLLLDQGRNSQFIGAVKVLVDSTIFHKLPCNLKNDFLAQGVEFETTVTMPKEEGLVEGDYLIVMENALSDKKVVKLMECSDDPTKFKLYFYEGYKDISEKMPGLMGINRSAPPKKVALTVDGTQKIIPVFEKISTAKTNAKEKDLVFHWSDRPEHASLIRFYIGISSDGIKTQEKLFNYIIRPTKDGKYWIDSKPDSSKKDVKYVDVYLENGKVLKNIPCCYVKDIATLLRCSRSDSTQAGRMLAGVDDYNRFTLAYKQGFPSSKAMMDDEEDVYQWILRHYCCLQASRPPESSDDEPAAHIWQYNSDMAQAMPTDRDDNCDVRIGDVITRARLKVIKVEDFTEPFVNCLDIEGDLLLEKIERTEEPDSYCLYRCQYIGDGMKWVKLDSKTWDFNPLPEVCAFE